MDVLAIFPLIKKNLWGLGKDWSRNVVGMNVKLIEDFNYCLWCGFFLGQHKLGRLALYLGKMYYYMIEEENISLLGNNKKLYYGF